MLLRPSEDSSLNGGLGLELVLARNQRHEHVHIPCWTGQSLEQPTSSFVQNEKQESP